MNIYTSPQHFQTSFGWGKSFLSKTLVVFSLIWALSGNTVSASCPGGELWVSAMATNVPLGWIKTKKSTDGQLVLIRDISCETLNAVETMIFESPLPAGWVRTSQQVDPISGYPTYYITCIKGASFLSGMYALAGFSIPTDWVVTNTQASYNFITCLAGAPYGDTETILSWSTYPTGWVIQSPSSGGYMVVQNLNKVTASITSPANDLTVSSGSTVAFSGNAVDSNSTATLSYSWNFGDGFTATGNATSHVYTNSGTTNANYTVTLKAWDQDYYYGTATRTITVNPVPPPPPPPVIITISPTSVSMYTDSSKQFIVSVSGTVNTSFTWSVTGGSISAKGWYTSPSDPGGYYVTATSSGDPSKTATAYVSVRPVRLPPPGPIEP